LRLPVTGLLVTRDRPLSVDQIQGGERQAMVASRHTFVGSGGAAIGVSLSLNTCVKIIRL